MILATHERVRAQEYELAIPNFFEEIAKDGLMLPDIENAIAHVRIRIRLTREPRGRQVTRSQSRCAGCGILECTGSHGEAGAEERKNGGLARYDP